uniref:Neurogenic locus notch-like protein 2 n=1 Tax=Magallana gigas TaxID=29159 RepID=K1PTT8_MAGGI
MPAKITVSWIPVGADLGKDILCARVEDNEGFESINLHCFTILIKPYAQHPQTPLQARPYFVFFPQPGDIVFPEHSFCKFPIYAASSTKGGITNISIQSTDAPSAVVVSVIRPVNSTYGPGAKMVEIQLKEPVGGVRKICFEASDADSSTVKCLFANVLKKEVDKCLNDPCGDHGICIDGDTSSCNCTDGYTGEFCTSMKNGESRCYFVDVVKNIEGVCDPNPCENGGLCLHKDGMPFCICMTGYYGDNCTKGFEHKTQILTDLAMPEKIMCHVKEKCDISFSISTNGSSRLTTDERCIDVVVENNKIQQTKGNSDFTHVFNLNTNFKAIGNNCTADVAIKPSSNHNSSDPYCFDVSFPSVPGEKRCFNVTYKEPEKTLCVGFLCENGGFCETKDLKATCKCPITTSGKNCQSSDGERRCFKFFVNNETQGSSCEYISCLNSGYCEGDVQGNTSCVCMGGHTGPLCSLEGGSLPTNHIQYSSPDPEASPKFIDTAIPNILPCKVNTECGISLFLKGNPYKRNKEDELCFKINVTDVGLHAKVTPIIPDARVLSTYLLGNHCLADVVVRTHKEDLNKSVCVQIDGTTISSDREKRCVTITVSKHVLAKPTPIPREKNNTNTSNLLPKFVDSVLPKEIKCTVSRDCIITIPVHGFPMNQSTLLFGHFDKGVVPGPIITENITDPTNQTLAYFHLKATNAENKYVCVQSSNLQINTDELCVKIVVANKTDIKNMVSSTITKVHSFTSDHPIGPNNLCHVDVTFKPEVAGNHTLCIQAKDNGHDGDERCYAVNVVTKTNITYGGPCQSHPCYNKGHCEADPTAKTAICLCPVGLSDSNCQKIGPVKPTQSTTSPTVITLTCSKRIHRYCDSKCNTMPNKLNMLDTPHHFWTTRRYIITEPTIPDQSSVNVVPHQSVVTSGTVVLSTEQTTFNQSLCVTDVATVARPVGQKTICLETSSTDKRCIDTIAQFHMTSISSGNKHVCFQTSDFTTSPQKLQHLQCLMELSFNVYLVKGAVTFLCTQNQCKVPANGGPCQQKHCYNNGKCEADPVSNSATCICPIGYPDENCLSNVSLSPPIPGSTVLPITKPIFTDTAIPDIIQCPSGSTCGVPLIIRGEPGKILVPMLSPLSPGMAVLTTEETQFDPNLCVTDIATIVKPSETKKLCVDVTGSSYKRCIIVNSVRNMTKSSCNSNPCYGNGYCKSSDKNGFICICKLGFKGDHCENSGISEIRRYNAAKRDHVSIERRLFNSISSEWESHQSKFNSVWTCRQRNVDEVCLKVVVHNETQPAVSTPSPNSPEITHPSFPNGGPCQEMHCQNEGKCEADPSSQSSTCICPIGFNDAKCESNVNVLPTAPGPTPQPSTKPIFTDTAIPDVIQCPAGAKCNIPLIIKGKSGKIPNVDSDNSLVSQPIETVHYPGKKNNTYQTNIQIIGSSGLHTVCSHIDDKG